MPLTLEDIRTDIQELRADVKNAISWQESQDKKNKVYNKALNSINSKLEKAQKLERAKNLVMYRVPDSKDSSGS